MIDTATATNRETEAYRELVGMAGRRTGSIPPELLAHHVLEVTRGADWPVRRAAMEALLRRIAFARRDELRVSSTPAGRAVLGIYETRRRRSTVRPYRSLLRSVDPPAGSCSCPDFARSSLGLCKHLLVVLEHVASRPGRLRRAVAAQERPSAAAALQLGWDPVRPLTGAGDWLERLVWRDPASAGPGRPSKALIHARRWFEPGASGEQRLIEVPADDQGRRLELVRDLLRFVERAEARNAVAADPGLVPLLQRERQRLEQGLAAAGALPRLKRVLATMRQRLYPYQVEGLIRFLQRGRLLLADDMGLGKTIQAIAACHVLWHEGLVRRGLLVVPASLKSQWLREWQLFSDVPVEVVDGSPAARAALYRSTRGGFLIANYEQVLRDLALMRRWQPELMVLDEAQRIKNWATKTAAYVKDLRPPYRLVLTGTPMENRLEELASIMDWVDDMALEPKWRLAPWHLATADGTREIAGARHLDTLRARLAPVMIRRLRREVLDQLPPRTDTRVPVQLTPEQAEEHLSFNQPIAAILHRAKRRPLTRAEFLRLMSMLTSQRIICNGLAQYSFEEVWPTLESAGRPNETLLRSLCSPKLLELRELAAQIVGGQRRKVVVFSQWRRMLRLARWALSDILDDAGARAVFFTGEEGQRRRTQNVVDFHDDPDTLVLFASDAGGVGLNLQRAASCCVNLELPWNPAVLEQRIGRIYRLGQKVPVQVYYLVTEGGIEERIAGLVSNKRALFGGLFDGASNEVMFERSGSFLDRIEQIIEPVEISEADVEDGPEADLDEDGLAAADLAPGPPPATPEAPVSVDARRGAGPTGRSALDATGSAALTGLLAQVEVRRTASGGITIEAPPEAAATLGALFEGMGRLLTAAGEQRPG
jgi:hypothetical protein